VREIVIVIADLYLEPELAASPAAAMAASPVAAAAGIAAAAGGGAQEDAALGIGQLARFGEKKTLPAGWRAWVAQWLGLPQFAGAPPASIAAAALADVPADRVVWHATPLHLMAGLTSVHFDRRSVLRPPRAELEALAASFSATFHGSGFALHPLEGGELLLSGPAVPAPAATTEPARMLLTPVAEALPAGEGAPALRRLGAEIEMWLHHHPVNDERARRGAPPVAALWVWGGGASAAAAAGAQRRLTDQAFGADTYVRGLWRLAGGESLPMPVDWAALIGESRAQRALGVVEVAELLHAHVPWSLADAVAEIDRRLIVPSLAALRSGRLERLVLLANDRSLSLRAADRWRLWRHLRKARAGVECLI